MQEFLYFAYGSNMLTARLNERCPSAKPAGCAFAPGYRLIFEKLGRDGSGKAAIAPAAPGEQVSGVLFTISRDDLPALDRAEWGYVRHDAFPVFAAGSPEPVRAVTYIAPREICRIGLSPFDWYLALIKAGMREHGLAGEISENHARIATIQDADRDRAARMFSLCKGNDDI